jgi:hypothetical protein
MRATRDLRSLALLVVAAAGFAVTGLEACATADGPNVGTDDNQDSAVPALDANRADRSTADFDAAKPVIDAAEPEETSTDAGADADSGPKDSGADADAAVVDAGPTTNLFFLGDFATNNVSQLGRALLPTSSANPIAITDGVHTATQVVAFDALANGTKIVVAADLLVAGRFDLVVANANGTGAVVIATMSATGGVSDIAISPDGTTVAFIADITTDAANDAYVVPIAGGVAPVRVSPRPTADAALDAQSISWSRDSVYVSTSGDFTVDKKNELFIADTSVAVPVPVAALAESALPAPAGTASVGISTGLRPIWTSGGKVCAKADLTGAATPVFRLYCAASNGTGFATPAHFPALPAQLGSYGLSPDGATLAFAADSLATDAYEIYTMPADDSAAPKRITSGTVTVAAAGAFRGPAFSIPLTYSPDGARIAFIADIAFDGRNELYVVAADGATTEKRVALVGTAGDVERDVQAFSWGTDSTTLAFIADHRVNNDFELFRIPNVTTADQTPTLVRGVAVSGDVNDLLWRP